MTIQPWADIPPIGPMLRPNEAARYLGITKPHLYRLANEGRLPRPFKLFGGGSNAAAGIPKPWLDAIIAEAAS